MRRLNRLALSSLKVTPCRAYHQRENEIQGRGRGRGRGGRGDGQRENRSKRDRRTFSPMDELNMAETLGISKPTLLVGELRHRKSSEVLRSKGEVAADLRGGTLTSHADADGIYKPAYRPKRITMPVDYDNITRGQDRRPAKSYHESHNVEYHTNVHRAPTIPTGRDEGGRARETIREVRNKSRRSKDSEDAGYNGAPRSTTDESSPNSAYATTSASYTSSGDLDKRLLSDYNFKKPKTPTGALPAAEVPNERSVGDCFRFLLDNCKILGVIGGKIEHSDPSTDALSSVAALSEGGLAVYDPVALPLVAITRAVKQFQASIENSGSQATTSASQSNASSIAAIGTSPERCSILPSQKRVGLSRKEVLALIARNAAVSKNGSHSQEKGEDTHDIIPHQQDSSPSELLVQAQNEVKLYRAWDLLQATPLDSPNNGATSHRGKTFAMHYISAELCHAAFPHIRSRTALSILHKYLLSPLAVINACNELGLTSFTNYETEVGLYRESIIAFSTFKHVRSTIYKMHKERFRLKNIAVNEYGRQQRLLKALSRRISVIPVDPDTLHLRYKWLEDLFFSFIDFVRQGEGEGAAKRIIDHYLAPTLARHRYRRTSIEEALKVLESGDRVLAALNAEFLKLEGNSTLNDFEATLLLLRNMSIDVLLIGDGRDAYGTVSSTDGIVAQQMLYKRHMTLLQDLVATVGVGSSSSGSAPATLPGTSGALHRYLRDEMSRLKQLISTDLRHEAGWEDGNVTNKASSSIASLSTKALDSILKYHPTKEEAHTKVMSMSTSSGMSAINPYMVEGGGSGLLLDSQGADEEIAGAAMALQLGVIRDQGITSANTQANCSDLKTQAAQLRTFMQRAFLPPMTLLATANSSIASPLKELQLILKYSPSAFTNESLGEEGATSSVEVNASSGSTAPTYSLHFEVRKEVGVFENNPITAASQGKQTKQQEYYVATLYMYRATKSAQGVKEVQRHILGTGFGPNVESATHAACMRVLRRYYFRGGTSVH